MSKDMSPSEVRTVTPGQISKLFDLLSAALCKSRLPSAETQQVMEDQGADIADKFVADVRRRVEAISEIIWREVEVDRDKEPQEVIDATGRVQYVVSEVVKSMPRGKGKKVRVGFFPLRKFTSKEDVQKAIAEHGLELDPYAVARVNEVDSAFGDSHPNGTQWADADGNHCYATFNRWSDERVVCVDRREGDWDDNVWVGGVPRK